MKKVTWKQRLEHIVSIITEGIIVFDRDGRITFANAEAEKILGLKRSTIIGRTFNDPAWKFTTVDGRPLPDDEHPFAWVMQTGRGIYGMELAVERPDGTEVPLSVNAGPLRDEKGTTDVVVSFLDVTEQKRAKSALRDSEERFHRCLDLSPESVTIYREGKIIYMNAAGAKLLGAKNPEEFIGKPVLSLIHPDYHEVMKDRVQQVQQGKVVGLVEEKFLSLDGRIIDVEVTVAPIIYQGKMAMLLVAHDITERKRAEERLRLFSEAVEGAPDGVQITDLNGYILYSNRAVERIYGYTPEEYRGRHVNEMNVDLEFASNVILPSIKETGRWAGEVMVKHKDGRVFPIWLTTSMVKDSKGNPIALIGIIRDITEQKRAEEELRFRSLLLDSATDSIFVHDLEGNMIYVNEAAYKTRGYTKEELMAMPLQRLDTPEYARLIGPRIESLLKTGSAVFESVHIKKDGSIMPIEVHTRIVEFGGRKVIASVVRDITERKRSEELSDALDNINAAINSTLNVSEIMQRVIVESTKAIGAETAGIDLREDGYWVIKYVYGLPEDFIGARFTDEDFKASALAARTKKLLVIDDARSDELANRELVERYGIRSMLIVPLVVRESAIGTLVFHYHSAQVPFTDTQVNFASKLGASISLALENARLYEAERNISDTLQEALLTAPERIEGVEFGYLYRSATEATRVGGDFYDLFEIEHGRVGIVIGDVSGKGLEAAALTSMVKNTIKAYAYEGASPASVMSRVNDMVKKASSSAVFVTVFFGILDTKEGTLFYCSAGHPPAILKREAGEIAFLITSSPVIGAFMGLNFIDDRATLKKGDVLILYTDGVTEARCDHEFFGEERLVSFIRDLEPTGAEKMPQVIFDEVMNCTGGVLSDDVALLCISVKGD